MKIKKIQIKKFKRFTDLTVEQLPETAKLILLVGPNGSGKTSLFEAFNSWYQLKGFSNTGDANYIFKKETGNTNQNWQELVNIDFHNQIVSTQQ
jgi:predicted ATP-dependent endonuclease of OLD family